MTNYTSSEMMIVAAARALAGVRTVFVGVGLPNSACNLARRTVAPGMELIYESGVYGARPTRLPLSIGDPVLISGATSVCSMADLFGLYLQGGRVEVAFLGGAQIDRFGNLNTTVIGEYAHPKVRLPGSGGACGDHPLSGNPGGGWDGGRGGRGEVHRLPHLCAHLPLQRAAHQPS